jgi:hypothetical protein
LAHVRYRFHPLALRAGLGAHSGLDKRAKAAHSCGVLEGVKEILDRWFGGGKRKNDPDEPNPPSGAADQSAGIRCGQSPPNYVPPVDEGRPPH